MSQRFLVIAVCFSVIGMTVVPARYMPCCCKAPRQSLGKDATSASCCHVALKTEETAEKQNARHSSCAKPKHSAQTTCHEGAYGNRAMMAGKAIAEPCPKCTCIAEMQIVALPGIAMSEKTYRLGDIAPLPETPIVGPAECFVESRQKLGHPGIVVTLQTCSFRC